MATNVSVIGVATSDYTTIAAWESDVQGDLVSAGDIEQGECKDQAFTEEVTIDGSTTDASNYMRLIAQSGAEHDGTAGNGARNIANSSGHVFTLGDPFTRLEGLGISHSSPAASDEGVRITADNCLLRKLVIYDIDTADCDGIYTSVAITLTAENCIIYNMDRAGIHIQNTSGTKTVVVNADNCTIMHCGLAGEGQSGAINVWTSFSTTLNVTLNLNNLIGMHTESTFDDFSVGDAIVAEGTINDTWNINNCIVSDGSITTVIDTGSNNLETRTETENVSPGAGDFVIFGDITAGTEDYKLQDNSTDNDAQAAGINLDTEFTDDIVGNTRPSSPTAWDIGAHEVTVAAPGGFVPYPRYALTGGMQSLAGV